MCNADSLHMKQGPMVGEKASSEEIVSEYAKADQVYVEKTMVGRPKIYPTWRSSFHFAYRIRLPRLYLKLILIIGQLKGMAIVVGEVRLLHLHRDSIIAVHSLSVYKATGRAKMISHA